MIQLDVGKTKNWKIPSKNSNKRLDDNYSQLQIMKFHTCHIIAVVDPEEREGEIYPPGPSEN